MSLSPFLLGEYSFILNETKKKQVDLRKSTEEAMAILKTNSSKEDSTSTVSINSLIADSQTGTVLVKPFILSLDPKQPRLFSESLSCINRLISQILFPLASLPEMIRVLEESLVGTVQSPDNALRIIQISMGIVLNYPMITRQELKSCFSICIVFVNQPSSKSKQYSPDVLNAASVTLRQISMMCVSKLRNNIEPSPPSVKVHLFATEEIVEMNSYVADVYEIINDIAACILGEKSEFLALDNLDVIHCLEMVESVLAGNSSILCKDELHLASAVRENLLPALVKKFGEKQNYSVYLRILRVFKVVFTDYFENFSTISRVVLELIIKDMKEFVNSWQHVLCLELLKVFFVEHQKGLRKMLSQDGLMIFYSFVSLFLQLLNSYYPVESDESKHHATGDTLQLVNDNVCLTGDFNRNRLKHFDQLEKSQPFAFSLSYLFQQYFEIFTHFIFELLVKGNLDPLDESATIQLCPSISFKKYRKSSENSNACNNNLLNLPIILKLTESFKSILSIFFEKFHFDESAFQLLHGLLYYSMVFGIFYGAEDLFCGCFDTAKRIPHEMTRHLLLQFAMYYFNEHTLDWYPILEITLEYPQLTESIYFLVNKMSLETLESFINGFCLLSFDSNSTDDVNLERFRFLLTKTELIFSLILPSFSNSNFCTVFRAILFHLVSLTYNKVDAVKIESMQSMVRIVEMLCSHFKESDSVKNSLPSMNNNNETSEISHSAQFVMLPANYQIELVDSFGKILDSPFEDIRVICYECIHSTLHALGSHNLTNAWDKIIDCIDSCHNSTDSFNNQSSSSSLAGKYFKVKSFSFDCLQTIISDLVHSVPQCYHFKILNSLSLFIQQQDDLNMSLSAIEYLWKFCDHLIHVKNIKDWLKGLELFLQFSYENRNEIRNASIQSLFRCSSIKNDIASDDLWNDIFENIFFQLVIKTHQFSYEESSVFAIQGLSNVIFNLFDYFSNHFKLFKIWFRRTCELYCMLILTDNERYSFSDGFVLQSHLNDTCKNCSTDSKNETTTNTDSKNETTTNISAINENQAVLTCTDSLVVRKFSEEYFISVIKAYKSILNGACKSSVSSEWQDEWKFAYDVWIKINQHSPSTHIHQSVLCQYIQSFSFIYQLIKQSRYYSKQFIGEIFENFYLILLRPMLPKEYLNDTEIMSLLQVGVLDQLSKTFDSALLPASLDLLVLLYSRLVFLPIAINDSPSSAPLKYPTSIALSCHILTKLLPASLTLVSLQEPTLIETMHNLRKVITCNYFYSLKRLTITLIEIAITNLSREDAPISDQLYSSLTGSCLEIINQISIDSDMNHFSDYLQWLDFFVNFKILLKFPKHFSVILVQQLTHLSYQLKTHEKIAFKCIEILLEFSDSQLYSKLLSQWVWEILLERTLQAFTEYSDHLYLCRAVPMIDVKYREIEILLRGFVQHKYTFASVEEQLRNVLISEQKQKDILRLVEQVYVNSKTIQIK